MGGEEKQSGCGKANKIKEKLKDNAAYGPQVAFVFQSPDQGRSLAVHLLLKFL